MPQLILEQPLACLLAGIATVVALALLGLWPLRERDTRSATRGEAIAHGTAALILFLALYFLIPALKGIVIDVGVDPPGLVITLLKVSNAVIACWYMIVPVTSASISAEKRIFSMLHRAEKTRPTARVWSAVITTILLFFAVAVVAAIAYPMRALGHDLTYALFVAFACFC